MSLKKFPVTKSDSPGCWWVTWPSFDDFSCWNEDSLINMNGVMKMVFEEMGLDAVGMGVRLVNRDLATDWVYTDDYHKRESRGYHSIYAFGGLEFVSKKHAMLASKLLEQRLAWKLLTEPNTHRIF